MIRLSSAIGEGVTLQKGFCDVLLCLIRALRGVFLIVSLLIALFVQVSCTETPTDTDGRSGRGSSRAAASPVRFETGGGPESRTTLGGANFGSVLPPSAPHLRAAVIMRASMSEPTRRDVESLGLSSTAVTAEYTVVGCRSGYLPEGQFTGSGSRILYRGDTGCAIAIRSLLMDGKTYTMSSGSFKTAPGSTNVFASSASPVVVALTVDAQLSGLLAPLGEEARFTAHLVAPGSGYSIQDFLIVTPAAEAIEVSESGAPLFSLDIQGSSDSNVTIYFSLAGSALPIGDYKAVSGEVVVPPGASRVTIPVELVNDGVPELDETIVLKIDNSVGRYFSVDINPSIKINDDDIMYPVSGLVARYVPGGQVTATGETSILAWNDDSGRGNAASQATAVQRPSLIAGALNGFSAVSFDGVDDALFPVSNSMTSEANFSAKSFSFVFRTGTNVTSRQVLYRQGDASRGLVIYVEYGFLYFAAYSSDGNVSNHWGVRSVRARVSADTVYIARAVFDQPASELRLFLDSELVARASLVKTYAYPSGQGSSLGGANVAVRFHDGTAQSGVYFQGLVYEFAHFSNATSGSAGLGLDIFLFEKYALGLPTRVSIGSSVSGVSEHGSAAVLTISRSQVGSTPLVVPLGVSGTATSGSDYQALPTYVTIAAYASSASVSLVPINDTVSDSGEFVRISVVAGQGYLVGVNSAVTVEIADDETYMAHSSQFIWYRASNVTVNGSYISAWPNFIAGGQFNGVVPQGSVNAPSLVANGINGRPGVRFDGNDQVSVPSGAAVNQGGPFSHRGFALVFRTGSDVSNGQVLYKQGNSSDSGMSVFISGGYLHFEAFSTSGLIFSSRVFRSVAPNSSYFAVLALNAEQGVLIGRLNGTDMTASANTVGQLPPDSGSSNGNSLGFNLNSTRMLGSVVTQISYFSGLIGEFMYFNAELTWARIFELEDYFLAHYGL